jgi:hypothetical protein
VGAGHRHAHRLHDLAAAQLELGTQRVEHLQDRLGAPLLSGGELLGGAIQHLAGSPFEVFGHRLLVVADLIGEAPRDQAHGLAQRLDARAQQRRQARQQRPLLVCRRVGQHAGLDEHRLEARGQLGGGQLPDRVAVEATQLVGVEPRRVAPHPLEGEPLDELVDGEALPAGLVTPAAQRQEVAQHLGQNALLAIVVDGHRAVALGQLLAVLAHDHRQVGPLRRAGGRIGPRGESHLGQGVVQQRGAVPAGRAELGRLAVTGALAHRRGAGLSD